MCTNPPSPRPAAQRPGRPVRWARAFTLMEVVIALTILGLITGTLFAIIQGSVRGAAQIEQLQRENDAIHRFLELCRQTFTTLPSSATLTLKPLDSRVDAGQELTISGSTHCFSFGLKPISYEDTILGLRPDPAGATDQNGLPLQYLCLSREDLIPATDDRSLALRQETTGLAAPDEQGRHWMPLLPDVVQLKWRFYKEEDDTWLEEWEDSDWPELIEVQLQMRDRTTPLRMVYSLPVIQIIAGRPTPASSASSTGASTAPAGNPGNAGGSRGGGNAGEGRGGDGSGGGRPSGDGPRRGGNGGRGGQGGGGSANTGGGR